MAVVRLDRLDLIGGLLHHGQTLLVVDEPVPGPSRLPPTTSKCIDCNTINVRDDSYPYGGVSSTLR